MGRFCPLFPTRGIGADHTMSVLVDATSFDKPSKGVEITMSKKTPVTKDAVQRVTSAQARKNGGKVPSDSQAARMQRSYDKSRSKK